MPTENPFEVEDRGGATIVNIQTPPRGLVLTDYKNMERFWSILHNVAFKKQKVLLFVIGDGLFAPEKLDQAWEDIRRGLSSQNQLSPQIQALHTNLKKLINYLQASRMLVICAFSGAVDFDLFGVLALSHYRICTSTSTIENRTIDRIAPPGSASIWFLSRFVGFARAGEFLLEGKTMTAAEAHDLKLVNAVVAPDQIESFAKQKAEYFASKSQLSLNALVVAMNNAHRNLPDYLDEVGTGYNAVLADE